MSRGVSFRPARPDDIRPLAELWCDAFPGRRTVDERVRMLENGGRYGGVDTAVVAMDRDELIGGCKLYRFDQRILGSAMPMMGLAAVAVRPEHRERGIGAALCTDALQRAARRGDVLSTLYPFRPEYYRRLGWGLVGELHDYRFRTTHLPGYSEAEDVREATPEDGDAIAACYDRVTRRSNGPIARDRTVWAYRLIGEEIGARPSRGSGVPAEHRDPRQRAIVYDREGVTGYALLRGIRTRSDRDARLEVRELVAEGEEAYRGLLGFIAGRAERWPLARHFARPEERFGDRLRDPRPPRHGTARSLYFPTCRVVRGPMLRVLDVPAALRLRPWFDRQGGRGDAATVRITLNDGELPRNDGPWLLHLDGRGGARVLEADGASPPRSIAAEIATDAATFARIYAGELPPAMAERLGHASLRGDRDLLDDAFAARERFWLLDEF